MNVLWHMPTLRRSSCGLSRRALRFAAGLRADGCKVNFLVAADKTDVESGDLIEGCPVTSVTFERTVARHWSWQARARVADVASVLDTVRDSPNFFISCQPEAIPIAKKLWPSVPALFVCGGISILHDQADGMRFNSAPWQSKVALRVDRMLRHRNERAAMQAADAVVFDSRTTRDRAMAAYGLKQSQAHTIYAAVDVSHFRPPSRQQRADARRQFGIESEEYCVTWTGRMSPEKNLPLLVDAAQYVAQGTRILLVGDGPLSKALVDQIVAMDLSNRVSSVGAMPDVRQALWASDAFVFPSISESFGLALVEAMAVGLPCLALRADEALSRNASAEILNSGACGVLVDENEPAAFAAAIDALRYDQDEQTALAVAGRAFASANFAWESGITRFNDLVAQMKCRFIGTGDENRQQNAVISIG